MVVAGWKFVVVVWWDVSSVLDGRMSDFRLDGIVGTGGGAVGEGARV